MRMRRSVVCNEYVSVNHKAAGNPHPTTQKVKIENKTATRSFLFTNARTPISNTPNENAVNDTEYNFIG
jgi:hypothetical protein